jgi:hypothetical protein
VKARRARPRKPPRLELDPQSPPQTRIMNATAMRGSWVDPDDIRPTAVRSARTITGYRAMCPLRQMLHRCGASSSITDDHVIAADRLRGLADAAAIGYSRRRELMPVQSIVFRPSTGPGTAAVRSARAWPALRAALKLFDPGQRRLLTHVVLMNRSVTSWCAVLRDQGLTITVAYAMHRLVVILDALVDHFDVGEDSRTDRAA